jgi:hypothetical protein
MDPVSRKSAATRQALSMPDRSSGWSAMAAAALNHIVVATGSRAAENRIDNTAGNSSTLDDSFGLDRS